MEMEYKKFVRIRAIKRLLGVMIIFAIIWSITGKMMENDRAEIKAEGTKAVGVVIDKWSTSSHGGAGTKIENFYVSVDVSGEEYTVFMSESEYGDVKKGQELNVYLYRDLAYYFGD